MIMFSYIGYIANFIFNAGFWLLLLISAILVHEWGHWQYLKYKYPKKKVDIEFYFDSVRKFGMKTGTQKLYNGLTNKEYVFVNLSGIAAGASFIIILVILFNPYAIILLPGYFVGCWCDIKSIYKVFKE